MHALHFDGDVWALRQALVALGLPG
jgi:hypothetical protein